MTNFGSPSPSVVEEDSDIAQVLKRAAAEQAGLHGFKRLDKEMYSYEWFAGNQRGRDVVFSAEVAATTAISSDTKLYSSFEWLPFQQALLHFKWDGNKDALRKLNERLKARKVSDPNYWRSPEQGLYASAKGAADGQQATTNAAPQTSPDNDANPPTNGSIPPPSATVNQVPKRLPDHPQESHESKDDDPDVNTGEWFL
jgi:hypothetical protein